MKKHLTIVIKLGTSSIVSESTHEPLLSILSVIVETAIALIKDGHRVVLVSSGAIGVALRRMNLPKRPKHLPQIQALAAIGQCRLMSLWDQLFGHMRQPVAQILLTRTDIADRTHWQNAKNTLNELLSMGVVPIVNENDTLSVMEIRFGDNDTLSAITAGMVQADYLFLMTDVDCLYDKNPRSNPDAKPITVVRDIAELDADTSSRGSALGTGGMSTKIVAARLATSAGVTTVITRSSKPGNIRSIIEFVEKEKEKEALASSSLSNSGTLTPATETTTDSLTNGTASFSIADVPLHTRFVPDPHPIRDRYFWLLHGLHPHGILYIDEGAHRALSSKAGLLPVGVVDVSGTFGQQEAVSIHVVKRRHGALPNRHRSHSSLSGRAFALPTAFEDLEGSGSGPHTPLWEGEPVEVGRALVNYSSSEIRRIMGLRATEIAGVLGYADSEYVALRENIAFLKVGPSRPTTPAPMETEGAEYPGASIAGFAMGMGVGIGGVVSPRTP